MTSSPGDRLPADASEQSASVASDAEGGIRRPTVRLSSTGAEGQAPLFSPDDDSATGGPRSGEGTRLGRYELLFEMATGGMATLHLAQIGGEQQLEKLVAIKKIHDHLTGRQDFVDMFLDEARITARIQHPNVVQLFDLGEADGAHFIAMEYVHGRNLAGLLRGVASRGSQTYDWPLAAWIVSEAAAGLHAAHELQTLDGQPLGLVHRDVSPQNILLSFDGNVKVADFGIAYAAERITHTQSGVLKGKIPYMSPEQADGKVVDRRSDIFALGTVLYESVCLKRLFKEPSESASLRRVLDVDVPPPRSVRPELPEALEAILLRALAPDPAQRYQTASELREDLRRLLVDQRQSVDAPQLAAVMHELFDEKKRQLDRYINEATQRRNKRSIPPTPLPTPAGVGTAEEPSELTGAPAGAVVRIERQGARWPILLVILAVFVITTVVVVYWTWPPERRDRGSSSAQGSVPPAAVMDAQPRSAPRPETRRAARQAPTAKPLLLKIRVRTRRARATIHFRGKAYRQNKLQLLVQPATAAEALRVEAPGYETLQRTILVAEGAELSHELRLKRRRRGSGRRTMRPRETPTRQPPRMARPRTPPKTGPMVPVPAMLSLE